MPSRKRSNTYWSTNTFAPSVAICIARIICHPLSASICIVRPICLCSSAAICIDRSICHRWRAAICIGQPICHPESTAICVDYTNMPPGSIIWLGQTPESGIPPNITPKIVTPEIHLQIWVSSATLIGQLATVTIFGAIVCGISHFGFSVWPSPLFGVFLTLSGAMKVPSLENFSGRS